ncbi:MAG TPA: acyl-CoA dehydrogenase [Polyangium sp.]|nr:acyl-CoA dehydrogenase [Polyangium sp.]
MNFDLTPEQKLLESTAASFVKKESPVGRLRTMREDSLGWSKEVWRKMAELGWLGLPFPESVGGFDGSFVDVAVILEQLGTTLVPEPYTASVLCAGTAIARAGDAEQQERFLAPLINGETSLAFAHAERGNRFESNWVEATATRDGDDYVLRGEKVFVVNGHAADVILVSARTSGKANDVNGISLFAIPRKAEGLSSKTVKTLDSQKGALISLGGVRVAKHDLLGAEGESGALVDEILDIGAAAACAEGLGVMRTALAMTVDYMKTREQFGVKIGTFQALQHRAVDMFVRTELARGTSILANLSLGNSDPIERRNAVSAAKVELAICGRYVTQQAIQLHGGIGITDEHDIGLYFKRMLALNTHFGDEEYHLGRYANAPTFGSRIGGASA